MKLSAEIAGPQTHRVWFTEEVFSTGNALLREALDAETGPARVLPCVDEGVLEAFDDLPARLDGYAEAHGEMLELAGPIVPVPGGEACKNGWAMVDRVLEAIEAHGIDRRSYVLAVGGGAVLDCVGLAAALAHRGVRLIRIPSTTLAQADAGIGVKNGVNAYKKKNFLGTFAVPHAVINDVSLLSGLSLRQWRSGFSEAVKVALLKDRAFFEWLEREAAALGAGSHEAGVWALKRSAALHFQHIVEGGDPFEQRSVRPLDFGHWSAHQLETLSGFELWHGEAVAVGVMLDALYSEEAGLLEGNQAARIGACLGALGFELYHPLLEAGDGLWAGLEAFREHLGGRLTLTLLRAVGEGVEVHEMDRRCLERAVARLKTMEKA